jgi:hypothetical protein
VQLHRPNRGSNQASDSSVTARNDVNAITSSFIQDHSQFHTRSQWPHRKPKVTLVPCVEKQIYVKPENNLNYVPAEHVPRQTVSPDQVCQENHFLPFVQINSHPSHQNLKLLSFIPLLTRWLLHWWALSYNSFTSQHKNTLFLGHTMNWIYWQHPPPSFALFSCFCFSEFLLTTEEPSSERLGTSRICNSSAR